MKNLFVLRLFSIALLSSLGLSADAATVTVNPAGGGDYTKVRDAIGDYGTWANSTGDTIELVDGVHLVAEADGNDTIPPLNGGATDTLTITGASGASPIIAMDPADPPGRIFFVRRTGTYIIEGITFIGADGVVQDDSTGVNRSVIQIDGDDPGNDVRCEVRDCVITRNTGANVPDFDYTNAIPTAGATTGTYRRAFYTGDAGPNGDMQLLVEDCVVAYTSNGNGAIRVERDPTAGNFRTFTFRNTLFVSNRTRALRCTNADTNTSFSIEGCAFVNTPNETLLFTDSAFGPSVSISDSIFAPLPAGNDNQIRLTDSSFLSTLTVERTTFSSNNNDQINFTGAGGSPGTEDIVLRDIIEYDTDSILRYNEPGFPNSLVVSNIGSPAPVRTGSQDAAVIQPFADDFGTAGSLTHNPIFENTTFDNTVFANIRSWDSSANNFMDVTNPSYLGRASDGSDLSGGAEFSTNLAGANQTCVTVDPGGVPAAGVLYNTLADAINNHRNGDDWSTGNDCIELVDGVHLVGNYQNGNTPDQATGNGPLTIRAQNAGNAIVALDPADIPNAMFSFRRNGTFILEGLTMIGADGIVSNDGGTNRTCVGADGDDPDQFVEVLLNDCVITQNSGSNVPNLDFSGTAADGSLTGTFRRGLYNGDAGKRGPCRLTFDCGVVAYCQNGNGSVRVERGAGDDGADVDWTLRHVLFASNQSRAFRVTNGAAASDMAGHGQAKTTFTLEECCLANHPAETFLITDNVFGASFNFTDTIFAPRPAGADNQIRTTDSSFIDLSLVRTSFVTDNADVIRFTGAGGQPGQDTIFLQDVIEWNGDSLFRYEPDGDFPGTLTVSEGIATDNAARDPENHPTILAAFSSLYGGAGPVSADPMFANDTVDNTAFANIRKWDTAANDFADVGNSTDYAGQGSIGSNLSGGAECPSCPVPGTSLTPIANDFGLVPTGNSSAEVFFLFGNPGNTTVNISSVSIIGANAGDFVISSDSGEGSLAPSETRTIGVQFSPTNGGSRTATLQVQSDDSINPTVQSTLLGEGDGPINVLDWQSY